MTAPLFTLEVELISQVVERHAAAGDTDATIVERAVTQALRALGSGASVSEACREGRRIIDRCHRLASSTPACNATTSAV